jgi:hypothetical protein
LIYGFSNLASTLVNFANPSRTGSNNFSTRRGSYGSAANNAGTVNATAAIAAAAGNYLSANVFNIESVPAYSIVSVNGDDIVDAGSNSNEAQVLGFSEIINGGNIGDLLLSGVVDNEDGTVTFNVPDPIHGQVYPAVSYYDEDAGYIVDVAQELVLSALDEDDEVLEEADIDVVFNPLSQFSAILCRDPELTDPTYLGPNLEDVPVGGQDVFWWITVDCDLNGRGRVSTDKAKTTTMCHWIASSQILKIYQVKINDAGQIVDVKPGFIEGIKFIGFFA